MEYFWTNYYTVWNYEKYGELAGDAKGTSVSEHKATMPREIYNELVGSIQAGPANVGSQ